MCAAPPRDGITLFQSVALGTKALAFYIILPLLKKVLIGKQGLHRVTMKEESDTVVDDPLARGGAAGMNV